MDTIYFTILVLLIDHYFMSIFNIEVRLLLTMIRIELVILYFGLILRRFIYILMMNFKWVNLFNIQI